MIQKVTINIYFEKLNFVNEFLKNLVHLMVNKCVNKNTQFKQKEK